MARSQNQVLADMANAPIERSSMQNIVGPQIVFDKHFLCMKSVKDEISTDQVTISNAGTATIYYEWRKVERNDHIEAKNSDGIQRFFGITIRNKLLPKETKTFTFSFRSTKPGMFFEEWEILTEPSCLEPIQKLTLNGVSIEPETDLDEIDRLDNEVFKINQTNFFNEIMLDILDGVRTPTPPLPNMEEPDVFSKEFEQINKKYNLWYGDYEMRAYKELIVETHSRLGTDPNEEYWDGSIDFIHNLINKIPYEIARDNLMLTFNRLVSYSKKVPTNRSQCYEDLRQVVINMCEKIPALDESIREETGMLEYHFEYEDDDTTEEAAHKMKEDRELRKAEWLKKTKKKPKSEEEDKQDMDDLKHNITKKVIEDHSVVGNVEAIIEMKMLQRHLDSHVVLTKEKWDEYYRKKSILDIGCEGKNVLLRLDLDVPLSEYIAPEENSLIEKESKIGAKIAKDQASPSTHRSDMMKSNAASTKRSKVEDTQRSEKQTNKGGDVDILKTRQIIDSTKIKKALPMVKYMIENLAIRTFIVGNLGERCGKVKPQNTMKFVWNAIAAKTDQPVHFQKEYTYEDDAEGVYILENLNSRPEEWGYVEPEPLPVVEEPEGEPEEQEPEEDLKGKKNPKDKKAEEAKKLEEAKKAEEAKIKLEEAKRAEEERLKAEAEGEGNHEGEGEGDAEKDEPEPQLTFKEIEAFKSKLALLGDIYVNDALDASLTHSNTVADLRTQSKVMGIRMTEEIRKLGMFFMYEYTPTVVIIGGSFKENISDRIMLFNSLIHCADVIFPGGVIALYFLKVLGVKLGPQDHLIDRKYLDICKSLLLKAHSKGVQIIMPTDF